MREQQPGECVREQQVEIDRLLVEVYQLNRLRQPDGSHNPATLEAIHVDLLTGVKEAAMPYAVSTVHQELREGEFWWLDQTPTDVAASGYKFHKAPAATERVHVEVAEAQDVNENLRPGMIKVFISPKMTRADAPYEIAKQEHLADDDMLRIHMLDIDGDTNEVRGKFMQSVLVRDIPLQAWAAMLRDPQNIFGKQFDLENETSALSIMKLHKALELPEAALPEGVVTLIEAVLPYLDDEAHSKVAPRLETFRSGQDELHDKAESVADRWLSFEVALADSLHERRAVPEIEAFVYSLQHQWSRPMHNLLRMHELHDGGIYMTPELAAKIEQAKQNTLWTAAAVATGNEGVLGQLDPEIARRINEHEQRIQRMIAEGRSAQEIAAVQNRANKLIASQNVQVGGGCSGTNKGAFGDNDNSDNPLDFNPFRQEDEGQKQSEEEDSSSWEWENGVCRIEKCPTRPGATQVGPCAVCRGCQNIFDKGLDPNKIYVVPAKHLTSISGFDKLVSIF